jgi:hypothetical protein
LGSSRPKWQYSLDFSFYDWEQFYDRKLDNFDTPQEKAERQAREKREEQARIEERAKNEREIEKRVRRDDGDVERRG